MKITKNAVVSIEYSLHLGDGTIIDASEGEPLQYLQGAGQIVPGLEQALDGLEVGASKKVVVAPADGYGDLDPTAVRVVPREAFPPDAPLTPGSEFVIVDNEQNEVPIRITAVENGQVTVDFNHPLAGKTLHFSIEVKEVREATADELEHGHAHGEGDDHGHDHDDHEGHDH